MGITHSGWVYQGPEPANKGKAPAATFSAIPEVAPLPTKKVTEQEDEAFMKISFAEDELPSEGQGHLWALHIVNKCNNHVVGRVMINNGSALNVCPVSMLKQMNVDMSRICASKTTSRAFDGSRREGILRPIEVEEYRNRRGLGFRPFCHEIVQARRGKHLHHLAVHYEKLLRGIPVPPLSQFFPAPPQVIGGASDSLSIESDDSSSDAVEAFLALPALYAVTEETSPGGHIRTAREDEELTNCTTVLLYSAMVADV
ncbi:hypothetical protein CRG98_037270 [Punica granatum]|uniref:Uncharacterized protein n=1 Tax=Punica granatum TaxID=22663 RepID=A0A2I0IEE1_PUNGR|nr:hypothetical protein CRG98_037270 [Punica granatum]